MGQLVQEQTGGQIQQNLGTAGAPSYSFVGDTGNGFFSPGAGISALATYGTARLTISGALGNVGIGTTTPQAALDVSAAGTASSFILVPRDTTANRPVAAASINGAIRYNTNNNALESFVNGLWQNVAVGNKNVSSKTSLPELVLQVVQLIRLELSLSTSAREQTKSRSSTAVRSSRCRQEVPLRQPIRSRPMLHLDCLAPAPVLQLWRPAEPPACLS